MSDHTARNSVTMNKFWGALRTCESSWIDGLNCSWFRSIVDRSDQQQTSQLTRLQKVKNAKENSSHFEPVIQPIVFCRDFWLNFLLDLLDCLTAWLLVEAWLLDESIAWLDCRLVQWHCNDINENEVWMIDWLRLIDWSIENDCLIFMLDDVTNSSRTTS